MTSKTITGIVSWLRGWFFTKDEIVQKEGALQTQINNKASQSDFNTLSSNVANKLDASDYVVDNSLSDSSTNPVQNKVINTALSNKSDVGHIHDDRYYTESEVDDLLDDKLDSSAYVVDSALSSSSENPVQNKVINTALSSKADTSDVPHNTSDLVNDGEDGTNPFVSDDDSRLSDARTPTSHSHGYIENDGTISTSSARFSTGNLPLVCDISDGKIKLGQTPTISVKDNRAYSNIGSNANTTQYAINGLINDALGNINTSLSGKASSSHTHSSADVTESTALSNIGTSANATQHDVNSAIDSIIGNLTGAEIIKVVTTLPTASASTQNALYLLSDDGQYDIYITTESSGSYSWEKLDDDVLSDLSIDWSDIQNKPSTFTPSSHSHGYINNDGTISSATVVFSPYNRPLIKDHSDDKVKAGATPTQYVLDSSAYSNIGSSPASTQYVINGLIDTAIGNINTSLSDKASKSEVIDWDTLTFVAKADDETGAITFDYLE